MDNALYYLAVNRQLGLAAEMDLVANNLANLNTSGFRREGLAFTEFVISAQVGESVSMADLGARYVSDLPGGLNVTGGQFDMAIEGDGFFAIDTGEGIRLTRSGAFQKSETGFLVTPDGSEVLDIGQAPIPIPAEATSVLIATDGTVSIDGDPVAQVGVFNAPREFMSRYGDTAFLVEDDAFEPVPAPRVRQGSIEQSNVDPVMEIARMIEVTRAYETAQSLVQDEDERIREAIQTIGKNNT